MARFPRPLAPAVFCRRGSQSFTLLELIVVAAIGAVLITAAVNFVLAGIRTTGRLASLRHLQDHAGWVQFLINHEIEQADRSSAAPGELKLTVPGFSDPTISYKLNTATHELRRVGPGIDIHGRLSAAMMPASGEQSELVARDVQSFVVTATNPRSPRYVLTLSDATGNLYTVTQDDGRGGGAYSRPRDITRSVSTPNP